MWLVAQIIIFIITYFYGKKLKLFCFKAFFWRGLKHLTVHQNASQGIHFPKSSEGAYPQISLGREVYHFPDSKPFPPCTPSYLWDFLLYSVWSSFTHLIVLNFCEYRWSHCIEIQKEKRFLEQLRKVNHKVIEWDQYHLLSLLLSLMRARIIT